MDKPKPSWPADYPPIDLSEAMACPCLWEQMVYDPNPNAHPDCPHCKGTGIVKRPDKDPR